MKNLDKIILKGLEIFAYHGVNPEEKEQGQKFVLDVIAEADLSLAGSTDNVDDTVSYAAMRKVLTAAFCQEKFDLIERAADAVIRSLFLNFNKLETVTVKVMKPEAPMNAVFEYAAVEITRRRNDL